MERTNRNSSGRTSVTVALISNQNVIRLAKALPLGTPVEIVR